MNKAVVDTYIKSVESAYRRSDPTEHTYRPYLKELIETLYPGVIATNEPKRVSCGAPDFIVTKKQTPLGYIETKNIDLPLSQIEQPAQMVNTA